MTLTRRTLIAAGTVLAAAAALRPRRGRAQARTDFTVGWNAPLPAPPSSLAPLADGGLLAACEDGSLVCLEQATGNVRWTVDTGSGPTNRPAIGAGIVAAANGSGPMHGIDPATGAVRWTNTDAEFRPVSAPAIAGDTVGVTWRGGAQNVLVGMDAASGEQRWFAPVESSPGDPLAAGSSLYVNSNAPGGTGFSYAEFDAQTGEELMRTQAALQLLGIDPASGAILSTAPDDTTVIAFDRVTGSQLWRFPVAPPHGGGWRPPVFADGTAYLGLTLGEVPAEDTEAMAPLYAIDIEDGTPRWATAIDGGVAAGPVADGGLIYVASGRVPGLYAVDAANGEVAWYAPRRTFTPTALAAAGGWLFEADAESSVTGWRPLS